MSKADSFVDNTSTVFIVMGTVGVFYYGIHAILLGWIVDVTRSLPTETLGKMSSYQRFMMDHVRLVFSFHAFLAAGFTTGAMGMMRRKRWAYRLFLACLQVDVIVEALETGMGGVGLFIERTEWDEAVVASAPLYFVGSQIVELLIGIAVLAVFIWLWVRLRRQEVRGLFKREFEGGVVVKRQKISVPEYLVAFASFIPFLGVFFALASLVLGAMKFKNAGWKLIALGVGGILLTVSLSVSVWTHLFGNGAMKEEFYLKTARKDLKICVMALEFHKRMKGRYPATLREIAPVTPGQARSEVDIYDVSAGLGSVVKMQTYQYELASDGSSYRLYGVGPDGKAGTSDDVFPELTEDEMRTVGYRK